MIFMQALFLIKKRSWTANPAVNLQLPVMRYGEITFIKKAGIFEKFLFSNYKYSDQFVNDSNYFVDSI